MGINIVQRAIGHHQLSGGFLSHLGHSGDIIRSIPHQRLEINELCGRYLIGIRHVFWIVIFNFRPSRLGLRNPDLNMLIGDLQQITVPRHQRHFKTRPLRFFCQRSQNIIGLQTRLLHNHNPHGFQDFLHHGNLLPQLFRHRFSGSLICPIHLMAEGGGMDVKGNRQIVRLFLLQNLKHNIQKAVHGISMQPLRITKVRHPVKCPVQNTMSVY